MNIYLIGVGSQVSKIRDLLNLSQQALSERMGVSRPIISNIEKDPTNMTITVLMALYVVAFGEVETRRSKLEKLDYSLWDKKEKRKNLIESIIEVGIDKKVIASTLSSNIKMPELGFFAAGLINPISIVGQLVEYFSRPGEVEKDSKVKKEDMERLVLQSVNLLEKELCAYFNLEKPSIVSLLENIKEGETLE